MTLALHTSPFALLVQGLRIHPELNRGMNAAPQAKAGKANAVPHWIDFLQSDEDAQG